MEAAAARAAARPKLRPRAARCATPLQIVFAAAEVSPWSKTGGLGDVMGALPQALAARGHRVMVVAPRHTNGGADEARYASLAPLKALGGREDVSIQLAGEQRVRFFHARSEGVDWVFVDHPAFQRPGTPYGDAKGPFPDNLFRFALLSLAALEAPLLLPLPPPQQQQEVAASGGGTSSSGSGGPQQGAKAWAPYGEDVTFVANDYHTALVPALLAAKYRPGGAYANARCALTLHNLAHQGSFAPRELGALSLPGSLHGLLEWRPPLRGADGRDTGAFGEPELNCLKAGIEAADALVTVSPTYAAEITGSPQPGGIDALLARRRGALSGIVNGVDAGEWAPADDVHIAARYSADDWAGARS